MRTSGTVRLELAVVFVDRDERDEAVQSRAAGRDSYRKRQTDRQADRQPESDREKKGFEQ